MSDLLLPGNVAQERLANAAMERQASFDMEEARRWTKELKRIDPMLEVAWVPEQATEFDHPGRWHVRRVLPGDYDEWWPLIGPNGEYRPPGPWIIDAFQASDMWNSRVHRSRGEAKKKMREAKRRARELEAEQRQDEMALAHRAAKRIRGDSGLTKRTDKERPRVILPPGVSA